jgi:hypothetical protein
MELQIVFILCDVKTMSIEDFLSHLIKRKSNPPKVDLNKYPIGTIRIGLDREFYIIRRNKEGQKMWLPVLRISLSIKWEV